MTEFEPYTYFWNLVRNSKAISEMVAQDDDHFSRASSIIAIDEFLAEMSDIDGYQFILIDSVSGQLIDKYSDNLLENRYFSFYILHKVIPGDFENKEMVLTDTHSVLLSILSRMFEDKFNNLNGLNHLDRNSVHYDSIGPLAHNWYGFSCSFMVLIPPNVFFNKEQWWDTESGYVIPPDEGGGEVGVEDPGGGGEVILDPPR